jgi:hypothetical protein
MATAGSRAPARRYVDSEARWFVGITGPLVVLPVLLYVGDIWILGAGAAAFLLLYLIAPPLSATVTPDGGIVFQGPLRRVTVRAGTLRSVRVVNPGEWREYLSLRVRGRLPVPYRYQRFQTPHELAAAVAEVLRSAPGAKVDPRAEDVLAAFARRAA